jgi:hypothetical protein
MCNLYSVTRSQEAMRSPVPDQARLGAIFLACQPSILTRWRRSSVARDGERELSMMRIVASGEKSDWAPDGE